jgi:hypothetical protein
MKAYPNHRSEGMDLRDYFASQAMQGLTTKYGNDGDPETRAKESYRLADAMIKEREKNEQ